MFSIDTHSANPPNTPSGGEGADRYALQEAVNSRTYLGPKTPSKILVGSVSEVVR